MDKKTCCYSFSHNHGSVEHGGIFENFERSLLEDPFLISMIMGGRVNENGGMKQIQFIFHVPKMVTQTGDSILQEFSMNGGVHKPPTLLANHPLIEHWFH